MKVHEVQKINIETAFEMSFVDLLKRRPYVSHIMMKLKRYPMETGRSAVGFKDRRTSLFYNPKFIRLMYSIGPKTLARFWTHEIGHVILMHPMAVTGTPMNEFVLDVSANALSPGNALDMGNKVIPCPICSVKGTGNTLEAYLNVARTWSSEVIKTVSAFGMFLPIAIPSKTNCKICNNTMDLCSSMQHLSNSLEFPPIAAYQLMSLASIPYLENELSKEEEKIFTPIEEIALALSQSYDQETAQFLFEALFTPQPPEIAANGVEGMSSEEKDEAEHSLKETLSKIRGDGIPHQWETLLEGIQRKKDIPWDAYLSNRMCQAIETIKEPSRLVKNRRYGFDYPGDKKIPKLNVVVGVDTSASMPSNILREVKSRVLSLKGRINLKCTIVEFDSEVRAVYDVEDMPEKVKGRGGTDLTAILDWVTKTEQPIGTLTFVFTDGDGPINTDPKTIKGIDVHWMLVGHITDHYVKNFRYKRSFIKRINL